MNPLVSIIIVSRNTCQMTVDCLGSIADAIRSEKYEVVLVDNASSDQTVEKVRVKFPNVKIVKEKGNTGFGTANNHGVAVSHGEILFLLNSDTFASEEAIDCLAETLWGNQKTGAVAPRLIGKDGKEQDSVAYQITPASELLSRVRKKTRNQLLTAVSTRTDFSTFAYLSGAALMVRRQAFCQVGGFDESFFFYCEDCDLCQRLVALGWELSLQTESTIVHLGGGSSRTISIGTMIEQERSKLNLLYKHYGCFCAVLVGLVYFFNRFRRALGKTIGVILTAFIHRRLRNQARAYWKICAWYLLGMPGRQTWLYRHFVCDWYS